MDQLAVYPFAGYEAITGAGDIFRERGYQIPDAQIEWVAVQEVDSTPRRLAVMHAPDNIGGGVPLAFDGHSKVRRLFMIVAPY
jgi:hypothetical protein